jgi:TatD DNase family protein
MFFDSHCHLTSAPLAAQFTELLERAREAKVTAVLNIGDNLKSSALALRQCEEAAAHEVQIWATVGVHPQHALEYSLDTDETTQALRELAAHPKVCAIGEIGLDYLYDETHPEYPGAPRDVQEQVLRAQLDLAVELKLPVVLHNRHADERLPVVMEDYAGRVEGVFHCFGSPLDVAKRVLDLGYYLGFTGLVTFKNAGEVREVAQYCPLDRLLIETDAPYLAPAPYRGKTNEPSFLPNTAATVAELHGITVEELGDITTRNTLRLFSPAAARQH